MILLFLKWYAVHVTQAGLEPAILTPQSSKCWHYGHVLLCPGFLQGLWLRWMWTNSSHLIWPIYSVREQECRGTPGSLCVSRHAVAVMLEYGCSWMSASIALHLICDIVSFTESGAHHFLARPVSLRSLPVSTIPHPTLTWMLRVWAQLLMHNKHSTHWIISALSSFWRVDSESPWKRRYAIWDNISSLSHYS